MPDFGPPPSPQDLQFQHAEPIGAPTSSEGSARTCVVCKQPAGGTYYQAQGQVVCPLCAQRIQAVQQAAPALSMMRAALYGGAAALGGCALYALVAIVLHAEIGLIAILVGRGGGEGRRPPRLVARWSPKRTTQIWVRHRGGRLGGGKSHPPSFPGAGGAALPPPPAHQD